MQSIKSGRFDPQFTQKISDDGGYGVIYTEYDIEEEMHVCVKILKEHKLAVNSFENELRAVTLQHQNVHNVFEGGIHENSKQHYLVSELCKHGDLFPYLKKGKLPTSIARTLFCQLLSGVEYLHSQNLVHLDLKPSNFFLDDHFTLKIADFGSMLDVAEIPAKVAFGTPGFMAPE